MYRKESDQNIVRDVRQRLTDLRLTMPSADWQMAVFASRARHPSCYRHHQLALLETVEPLLRAGDVDMSEPGKLFGFLGIAQPE
jgi:hypothetical protein